MGEAPSPGHSFIAAATGSDDRIVLAERRAALLCELAESQPGELLLVVDGLELVADDESASHLLRVLSLQAPARLHLVLSGRSLPDLGLGGAQGRGELLEMTAPDLSFTLAETGELVQARLGPVTLPLARECWSLTGGWPAALQLLLDRLERLAPADHGRALERLAHSGGHVWSAFARDLLAAEQPGARRVMAVAALAPRVDAAMLAGVGVPASAGSLESLRNADCWSRQASRATTGCRPCWPEPSRRKRLGACGTRRRAGWKQTAGWTKRWSATRTATAVGAVVPAPERPGADPRRRGSAADRGAAGARHRRGPGLDAVLAEALQAAGEWDAAIELFARVERAGGPEALTPGVAWRYGLLLYLRGQTGDAAATLSAAHDPARLSADDAMVSACLSTTLWSQGRADAAAELAITALRQAGTSGDTCALAAAHVSLALVAASRGERERNEQEYRLALAAARDGGDRVQLARIHANLSSRALESAEYGQAIAEAELALATGAGHRFFSALALTNKAEAHLRLGQFADAGAAVADAEVIYQALGTLHGSILHVVSGELYRQRGDLVRARNSFERACTIAEQSDDAHTAAHALCGLARVLAEEDLDAARQAAAAGLKPPAVSSVPRRCARRPRSSCAAGMLSRPPRRPGMRRPRHALPVTEPRWPNRSSCKGPRWRPAAAGLDDRSGQAQLRAAVGLWEDVGNVAGAARARLALALLVGDGDVAEACRQDLTGLGVAPSVGVPGLLRLLPAIKPARSAGAAIGSRSWRLAGSRYCGPASRCR